MTDLPGFDDAIASFARFVEAEGHGRELTWVFREDVTSMRRRLWIRVPVPTANRNLARELYETARVSGVGSSLVVLGDSGHTSACYVEVHGGLAAFPAAGTVGLCLSVPTDQRSVRLIRSALYWRARRWRNQAAGLEGMASQVISRAAATELVSRMRVHKPETA